MEELGTADGALKPGTMVGGVVDEWFIADRIKPGKRPLYVLRDLDTGRTRRLRGEEVVGLIRVARRHGLPVVMPRDPWRDETEKPYSLEKGGEPE